MDFQNQTFSGAASTATRDGLKADRPPGPVFDCQWHWYPRAACEAQLTRTKHPLWRRHEDGFLFEPSAGEVWHYPREYVDLERQLEIMEASGIDMALISPVIAADVSALELSDARELCTLYNEEAGRAQQAHPGRLHGLAVVPMQDADAAVEVLTDAVERLGLRGVVVHSNVAGGSIADPSRWPVYAAAQELGVPVFLHPTRSVADARVSDYALEHPLTYMFETTTAALSLIVAGVLDAYPDLAIVHPHFGGTLPYLTNRVEVYQRQGRWTIERPIGEYLAQFYTDTVSESPGALRMAIEAYGVQHILFASDFPYFPAGDGVRFVSEHLAPSDAREVFYGNARRLLGIESLVSA
jgi:aminocarboxymuconate-semialdehyde decarboxylase